MQLYFIQATYNGNMYKLSDFFTGKEYKLNPSKMLDINFVPDDGITSFTTKHITLPDGSSIREYTHIIIPQFNKVYRITSIDYLNINQYSVILDEDPFIANYQELKDKKIQLVQTNDPDKFLGYNAVKDLAVRSNAILEPLTSNTNDTGTWVLFTFQSDVNNLEFKFGDISNYPTVGSFPSLSALELAYPPVDTSVPYQVPYFLKFAEVTSTNELYQAVYSDEDGEGVSWVSVRKTPVFRTGNDIEEADYTSGVKVSNLGDISTVQVAFPIDATLVQQRTIIDNSVSSISVTDYFTVPCYNSIKSWNNPDKLISIKLVPQSLLGIEIVDRNDVKRITNVTSDGYSFSVTKTVDVYFSKVLDDSYLVSNGTNTMTNTSLTMYTARQFKDIFTYNWSYLIDGPETYEPFKKYFLYFYGEMISIPARYVSESFNIRLVVTSTGVLYEVYTDHMNIIASGRLPWDTTYQVDQLELFYASNPTYKDQFNINMMSNLLKSSAGGVIAGAVAGPTGMAAGAAGGIIGGVVDTGLGYWSESLRQKGLRDKADQIYGQNEVALTNLKGFGVYMVVIEPENTAKIQMLNELYMTGWSCSSYVTVESLPYKSNSMYTNGKIITGRLLEIIRNNYVTRYINSTLAEGVIILQ